MPDAAKLRRLREMRDKLTAGSYDDNQLKALHFADTDGAMVRMGDQGAHEALDRRIAAEQSRN